MRSIVYVVFFTLIACTAFATIRIVDNSASAMTGAYTTLQTAHDAAVGGDTLFVIGTNIQYGSLVNSKNLKWFGPGFFLSENPETQANTGSALTTNIELSSGSEGSMIVGFQTHGTITINSNNILVRRCCVFTENSDYNFNFGSISNVVIEGCYAVNSRIYYVYSSCVNLASSHNVTIQNCFLHEVNANEHTSIVSNSDGGPFTIRNNVLYGSLSLYNSNIDNNILRAGTVTATSSGIHNNLANSTQFGSANGNQTSVNMTEVFLGTGSTDGQWRLSATSPAIGAGLDGVDCGMFGGSNPYVLSGIPNLPTITFISAPTSGSTLNGLPVTIRARGRN